MSMNENRYTKAVGQLKLSDGAMNKGIERMRNQREKGRVVSMTSRFINIKTAAAALLVLAVGMGAVFSGNYFGAAIQPIKNTFTLTANAQELSYDTKVLLYEEEQFGQTGGFHGYYRFNQTHDSGLGIQFPLFCEGDDIESVTYTVKPVSDNVSMEFVFSWDYADKINFEQTPFQEGIKGMVASNGEDNYWRYRETHQAQNPYSKEYTVKYENQPDSDSFYTEEARKNAALFGRLVPPVIISIGFQENAELPDGRKESDYRYDNNTGAFRDYDLTEYREYERDAYVYYFGQHSDEMKVYITVHFKDGTTQTRTLQLYCENNPDVNMKESFGAKIYGKIVE